MTSRRREVVYGIVIPVLATGLLTVLGIYSQDTNLYVGLLAAVPLFAALFARVAYVAIVSVLAFAGGLTVALLNLAEGYLGAMNAIIALIIVSAIAVVASRLRFSPVVDMVEVDVHFEGDGKRRSQMLRSMGDTDPLTGLLTRRGAVFSLGDRNAGPDRVVAFVDCDGLAAVNEEFGVAAGDEFLQAVAGRMRHALPPLDLVARWDEDEFFIVVETDPEHAEAALERALSSVKNHPIRTAAGIVKGSVSVGACVWHSGEELDKPLAMAGSNVYAAREQGPGHMVIGKGSQGSAGIQSSISAAEDPPVDTPEKGGQIEDLEQESSAMSGDDEARSNP